MLASLSHLHHPNSLSQWRSTSMELFSSMTLKIGQKKRVDDSNRSLLKSWVLHGTDVKLGEMQGTASVGISISESRWRSTGYFVRCYKHWIVSWVHFSYADMVCLQNTVLLLSGNIWLIAVGGICESCFKSPADTTHSSQMFQLNCLALLLVKWNTLSVLTFLSFVFLNLSSCFLE